MKKKKKSANKKAKGPQGEPVAESRIKCLLDIDRRQIATWIEELEAKDNALQDHELVDEAERQLAELSESASLLARNFPRLDLIPPPLHDPSANVLTRFHRLSTVVTLNETRIRDYYRPPINGEARYVARYIYLKGGGVTAKQIAEGIVETFAKPHEKYYGDERGEWKFCLNQVYRAATTLKAYGFTSTRRGGYFLPSAEVHGIWEHPTEDEIPEPEREPDW